MAKRKFRTVLITTLIMSSLAGLIDLAMVKRWNLEIGIPDKVFYVLGEAIIENMVNMLFWIPSSAIISKVCTHGLEATTYAFLAGLSNFSGMVADLSGAVIFEKAGVSTVAPNCNFDALYWLIIVCNIISPLVIGIPATMLIPNKRQTDQLVQGGNAGTEEVELEEDGDLESEDGDESAAAGGLRLKAKKTGEWLKKKVNGEETNEKLIDILISAAADEEEMNSSSDDESRRDLGLWIEDEDEEEDEDEAKEI